jgi:hypothetical protein
MEVGVDFFVEGGPGLGIKFKPGDPIWMIPMSLSSAGLMPDQMLRIIAAADIPLSGWDLPLSHDWLDNPRREVLPNQKQPQEVLRSFWQLLQQINSEFLYDSLKGGDGATTSADLRLRAKKLRNAATAFELPRAKRSLTSEVKKEFADARSDLEEELSKWATRFEHWADMIGERKARPLLVLMPALVTCFEQIFDRRAATRWKPDPNSHRDNAAGPFIGFVKAFLQEIACRYSATTIHTDLYDFRRSQKSSRMR